MPTLHIRLTPGINGITKCELSNPLKSQNLRLQSVVTNKSGAGYTGSHYYIRLPFASASQIHTTDKKGFLLIPSKASASGLETFTFSEGLPIECDHIPEVFEAQLFKSDMTPFDTNTNLNSVNLYFGYETHSLF